MNIPAEIKEIRLKGLLPAVFDDTAGRSRFEASQVFLADLTLRRGNTYCINATSGTGKTSLCGFLYGSRRDYAGDIFFGDVNARSLGIDDWCDMRRLHLAYLPQELEIFDELSALDNVRLKNLLTRCKTDEEISAMFHRLEIDNLMHRPAGRISVGQRQRVAIIRALCQPFDFIILDEPVSHLDPYNNSLCAGLITEEAAACGAGIIFTSVGNQLNADTPVIPLNL